MIASLGSSLSVFYYLRVIVVMYMTSGSADRPRLSSSRRGVALLPDGHRAGLWAMAALAAVKLWLVAAQQRTALGTAAEDDALFLRLAQHLLQGEWLGPYDSLTLVKGPGYPLWIAANALTGLPLHVVEHVAYAVACALFVLALAPGMPSRLPRLVLYAVLLFQPMSYGAQTLRYTRDALYTVQTLTVCACLFGLMLRLDQPWRRWLPWSAGLGAAGGFLWITREEGVWILPAAGVASAGMAFRVWRSRGPGRGSRLAILAAAWLLGGGIVAAVALQNRANYGIGAVSEFTHPVFARAYGSLTRVNPERWQRWVPVAAETRARIYRHSPAFRQLEPYLEGPPGRAWAAFGKAVPPWNRPELRGEILGGWFVWAMRDAATHAGHHASGAAALRYYSRLAAEVEAACGAGLLRCAPARATLAPPWRQQYLRLTLAFAWRGAVLLHTLPKFQPRGLPSEGTDLELEPFRRLTADRLAPRAREPGAADGQVAPASWKLEVLGSIGGLYQLLLSAIGAAGALALAACLAVGRLRRRCRLLGPALVLLLAIGTRLLLLAYVHATSVVAMHALYLLPLFPLTAALWVLSLTDAARGLGRRSPQEADAGEGPEPRCA